MMLWGPPGRQALRDDQIAGPALQGDVTAADL